MSDMYVWRSIVGEGMNMPFRPGETVKISKSYGGGVGEFVDFSPGKNTAIVNVKGTPQEFTLEDIEAAVDPSTSYYAGNTEEQRYDEIDNGEHHLLDKPDLQPGDMVKIDGLYGSGNGEGYGVFQAYALDGQSALCNVDSEVTSFPISTVSAAPEEIESDKFGDTGNDGSLSPMSFGDNNRLEVKMGDSNMDNMQQWMSIVSGNETSNKNQMESNVNESECNCMSYDCNHCFPLTESEKLIDNLSEEEEFDEIITLSEHSGEVGDMISKIEYMQELGMSDSSQYYDPEQLYRLKPEQVKLIHDKVVGQHSSNELAEDPMRPDDWAAHHAEPEYGPQDEVLPNYDDIHNGTDDAHGQGELVMPGEVMPADVSPCAGVDDGYGQGDMAGYNDAEMGGELDFNLPEPEGYAPDFYNPGEIEFQPPLQGRSIQDPGQFARHESKETSEEPLKEPSEEPLEETSEETSEEHSEEHSEESLEESSKEQITEGIDPDIAKVMKALFE